MPLWHLAIGDDQTTWRVSKVTAATASSIPQQAPAEVRMDKGKAQANLSSNATMSSISRISVHRPRGRSIRRKGALSVGVWVSANLRLLKESSRHSLFAHNQGWRNIVRECKFHLGPVFAAT